jgi:2-polyprenyl-3-methyl-5-hydroxy-6-metoxy-1,4-benzoquinol methylase
MDIDEFYRQQTVGKVLKAGPRLNLAASFFNTQGCHQLIDIAGNDGFFASIVSDINNNIIVDAVDLNEELTILANKFVRNSYNFDVTKAWPLHANSYDGIHMGAIIEHVFDYNLLFAESFRVLCPGGSVFISTPNMACVTHRVQVLFGQMPGWYTGYDHIRLWTASFLKQKLEENGFKVIKTYGVWEKSNPGILRWSLSKISSLLPSILIAEAIKPMNNNKLKRT